MLLAVVAIASTSSTEGQALQAMSHQPRMANVFQSHMVLQREAPIRVWGFGASTLSLEGADATDIVVTLGPHTAEASVDGDTWEATLPAYKSTPRGVTLNLTVAVGSTPAAMDTRVVHVITDVAIGDVYLWWA